MREHKRGLTMGEASVEHYFADESEVDADSRQQRILEAMRQMGLVEKQLRILRQDELITRLRPAKSLLLEEVLVQPADQIHYSDYPLPEPLPLPQPDNLVRT